MSWDDVQKLRSIAQEVGREALWSKDLVSGEGIVSPRLAQFLGYEDSPQDVDPLQLHPHLHPDDLRSAQESFQALLEGSVGELSREFRLRRTDGTYIWVQSRIKVLRRGRTGRPEFLAGCLTDITQDKLSEAIIRQKMDELRVKNHELEEYTYTVSHDLKSPLLTIKGFLGAVLDDLSKGRSNRVEQDVARILKAADHMQALLDGLLSLSRVGRISHPPVNFSMEDCVREVLENLTALLHQAQAEVRWEGALGNCFGDKKRIGEVWQNLIENSVKYRNHQIPLVLIVGCRQELGERVYFLKDNGKGLPKEALVHIFDLFTKLDSKSEGTGIGLATVRKIVEFHHGRVWAVSAGRGQGAEICFTLGDGYISPA